MFRLIRHSHWPFPNCADHGLAALTTVLLFRSDRRGVFRQDQSVAGGDQSRRFSGAGFKTAHRKKCFGRRRKAGSRGLSMAGICGQMHLQLGLKGKKTVLKGRTPQKCCRQCGVFLRIGSTRPQTAAARVEYTRSLRPPNPEPQDNRRLRSAAIAPTPSNAAHRPHQAAAQHLPLPPNTVQLITPAPACSAIPPCPAS